MKKMRKIFTLLMGILLLSTMSFAQLTATFKLPTMEALPGTDIVVPVVVDLSGAGELASFGMYLSWDPAVLTYKSYTIKQSQLALGSMVNFIPPATVGMGWFTMSSPAYLPPNDNIIDFVFTYNGGTTEILFDEEGSTFATDNTIYPEPITYINTFVNGLITQQIIPIIITSQPSSTAVCDGSEASFTVEATGQQEYQWQVSTDGGDTWSDLIEGEPYFNVNTAALNIIPATLDLNGYLYKCVLTNNDGSEETDPATLTVNALPAVDLTLTDGTLYATPGYVTYQWYLNANPIEASGDSYTPTESGEYSVMVTDENECSNTSASVYVEVLPPLTFDISATVNPICAGSSTDITVSASGGTGDYEFLWSTEETTSTITVSPESTTTYLVTITSGSLTQEGSIEIVVNPLPVASIVAGSTTVFCDGGSVGLSSEFTEEGYSYQWWYNGLPIEGADQFEYTATLAGEYLLEITALGCNSVSDPITVTVNPLPSVDITPSGTININEGEDVLLTANTEAESIQWRMDGEDIIGANGNTYLASMQGIYTVFVTDANECSNISNEVIVNVFSGEPLAVLVTAEPAEICLGDFSLISANATGGSGSYSYLWSNESTEPSITVNPESTAVYSVTVIDNETSDEVTGEITLVVKEPATAFITPQGETSFCDGGSVSLLCFSADGYTYQWYINGVIIEGATNRIYEASVSGLYTVEETFQGCTSVSEPVEVSVFALPEVMVTPEGPIDITEGETVVLTATTEASTIQWRVNGEDIPDANDFSYEVSESGVYTAFVSDGVCDNESNAVQVNVNPLLARLQVIHNAADPAASVVDIYVNGSLLLDDFAFRTATPYIDVPAEDLLTIGVAPGNSTSEEDIIASFDVTLANGGTYIAVATGVLDPGAFAANPDGRSTGFTLLFQDNMREAALTGDVDFRVIHGSTDAPTIDVIANEAITLVDDAAYGDITDYITVPPAAYQLDITLSDGITGIDCYNADLSELGGGAAVVFASGFVTPEENQDGAEVGLFAALPNGNVIALPRCQEPPSFTIDVNAKPGTICQGNMVTLQALPNPFEGNYAWQWSNGQTEMSFNDYPEVTTIYYVTVTDMNNMTTVEGEVTVTVETPQSVEIIATGETSFCAGESVTLETAFNETFTYQWYLNGEPIEDANDFTYIAYQSGIYQVNVNQGVCVVNSNEIEVTVNPIPDAIITPAGPVYVPEGETTTLTAMFVEGAVYQWRNNGIDIEGATDNTYMAAAGSYTVFVTLNGCSQLSNEVNVIEYTPNVCDLNVPTNLRTTSVLPYSASFAWDQANPEQDSAYILRVFPASNPLNIRYKVTRNITEATMGRLAANTNYRAQVRTRCTSFPDGKLHKSAYSTAIDFTTLVEPCQYATNLQSQDITENTAFVSWNAVPNANKYTVRYIGNQPDMGYHYRQTETNSKLLEWLKPGTQYTWDVKVWCDATESRRYYLYQGTFTTPGTYGGKTIAAEMPAVDMYVYPNPSDGIFTVSVSGLNSNANMTVQNVQGQVVFAREFANSFTEDIDLSDLAKGVYFIKIVNESSSQIKKIVIQ